MNSFVGIEESFAVSAEEFGLHFAASKGEEVAMPDVTAGEIRRLETSELKAAAKDLISKAAEDASRQDNL